MWSFSLNKFFGFDKVCFLKGLDKKLSPGDLIKEGDIFFIIIGDKIEYKSLYQKFVYQIKNVEIVEKKLFSQNTINFIHRMVKTRFTAYKKVINLFLPTFEIEKLLKYKKNKKKKIPEQKLFVFPDLWTAYNILQSLDSLYSSHNTTVQKIKLFRDIKSGRTENLYCTSSIIFQDRANLRQITIYYPHKRYYKNQQDPRYDTFEVVKKMSEIYNCKLKAIKDYSL